MSIWLVMKTADGRERPFSIEKPKTIIGRETRCDVRIPISSVSNRHCELHLSDGELKLTDLNSDAGTFHNGNKINQAILTHNDTVTVGPVTFVVRILPSHQSQAHMVEIKCETDHHPNSTQLA